MSRAHRRVLGRLNDRHGPRFRDHLARRAARDRPPRRQRVVDLRVLARRAIPSARLWDRGDAPGRAPASGPDWPGRGRGPRPHRHLTRPARDVRGSRRATADQGSVLPLAKLELALLWRLPGLGLGRPPLRRGGTRKERVRGQAGRVDSATRRCVLERPCRDAYEGRSAGVRASTALAIASRHEKQRVANQAALLPTDDQHAPCGSLTASCSRARSRTRVFQAPTASNA